MKVSILGGSGYVGGELLRLLLTHPYAEVQVVTSKRHAGEYVHRVHPNLRGASLLRFSRPNLQEVIEKSDLVFMALPHGKSMEIAPMLLDNGVVVIDLSADFRLRDPELYKRFYGTDHSRKELLGKAVYGLPELHREDIRRGNLIAIPGCMATAAILGLAPLVKENIIENNRIVIDVMVGSSGAGSTPTMASHHPERFGGVRPYRVVGHRHVAEIEQELSAIAKEPLSTSFSPHAVNMVRGILATIHAFPKRRLTDPELWKLYRSSYADEPFIRLVRDRKGLYRLPNPKVTVGTNYCDIGFELGERDLVVLSVIDNLMKGAAGQAVQCFNIILGVDECTGLHSLGLHPL